MEAPGTSVFTSLPRDISLDLLLSIPASSVINFYLVNLAHLKLFDDQHGLWEFLARGIFNWSSIGTPFNGETNTSGTTNNQIKTNWKKEFRMASYIREKLINSRFHATVSENEVTIAKNSIRVAHPQIPAYRVPSVVQGDATLYPLPIGNFTLAYFEVELIRSSDPKPFGKPSEVSIGGALYGYSGLPGIARSSYGINSSSDVFLECEYTTLPKLTAAYEQGDIMGFGINFATSSVFFTKNGNLVHETAKNAYDRPLQNLMNLYPTISLLGEEVVVNLGSHPFAFDLLKYQQSFKDEPKPLKLYTEIIVPHLISFPDKGKVGLTSSLHFLDKNLPKGPIKVPHYLHLLVYGEPHPESKTDVDPNELVDLESFRMVLNLIEIFSKLPPNETDRADKILRQVAPIIEERYPDFKSQPWARKVAMTENVLQIAYHEQYMQYVSLFSGELIEYNDEDNMWALKLLAEHQMYYTDGLDDKHWVIKALWPMLDPQSECQSLRDMYTKCITDMLKLRMVGFLDVVLQRYTQFLETKSKEKDIMKKISCNDEMVEDGFARVIEFLTKKVPEKPIFESARRTDLFGPILAQLDVQRLAFLLSQPQSQNSPEVLEEVPKSILYGVYKLKIPVDNFGSAREYLEYVMQENRKLVTNELKIAYLESVVASRADLDREDIFFGPLRLLFGFQFDTDAPVEKLRDDVKNQLEERIAKYREGL